MQQALEELNANLLPAARLPWPCEERPRQQASRKLDRACLDAELATADAATRAHLRLASARSSALRSGAACAFLSRSKTPLALLAAGLWMLGVTMLVPQTSTCPVGGKGSLVCWDFAVTSGLQAQDLHGAPGHRGPLQIQRVPVVLEADLGAGCQEGFCLAQSGLGGRGRLVGRVGGGATCTAHLFVPSPGKRARGCLSPGALWPPLAADDDPL